MRSVGRSAVVIMICYLKDIARQQERKKRKKEIVERKKKRKCVCGYPIKSSDRRTSKMSLFPITYKILHMKTYASFPLFNTSINKETETLRTRDDVRGSFLVLDYSHSF